MDMKSSARTMQSLLQIGKYAIKYTCLSLVIPMLLTGCWDSMEINNRSVILEFCLDKTKGYKEDPTKPLDRQERYEMTYSIPDMAKLSGTESLAENMKTIISIKAPTIGSGIDDLETKTRNTVSFSHVKALLVGEGLLRDGKLFKEGLDAISRDMLLARNVPLLAVEDMASRTAYLENTQHPIVGLYILNYFNNKERPISYFKHQLLGNFIRETQDTGVSTMPVFNIKEENEIDISGGVVMKDYELVDYLTKEEVRGQLFVEGKIKDSPVVIKYENDYLTYVVRNQKSKIKFEPTADGLVCNIEITADGDLSEYVSMPNNNIFNKQSIEEIRQLLEKEIDRQVQLTIDKSKIISTDFLQIGLELYRYHPKWWVNYAQGWQEGGYVNMPVNVKSRVRIKNTGVLQ